MEVLNPDSAQLVLVARRAIAAGEEVTISYVDEDAPTAERQRGLASYGFRCECRRCTRKRAPKRAAPRKRRGTPCEGEQEGLAG